MGRAIYFLALVFSVQAFAADECDFIRQAINKLPAIGGMVKIPAGTFVCTDMVIIKKSNVILQGAGMNLTTLKLADHSENPLLVIGDDEMKQNQNGEWITATRVKNIEVSDLTLDGNFTNEDINDECEKGDCDDKSIRNNGITIRGASYVRISNVTAHDGISGGMVTEKYCDHLSVDGFTSYGNRYDGFAGYETTLSTFSHVNLSYNHSAGISIDLDFDGNTFDGGTLANNGDVGIFARQIHGDVFANLSIIDSGNHGAFLADSGQPNTCANNNEFRSVTIEGSKGYGIFLTGPCTGNSVTGHSTFDKNSGGCYFVDTQAEMKVAPGTQCIQ